MNINHNVVGWPEIPVLDMDKPVKFYQEAFGFGLPWVEAAGGKALRPKGAEKQSISSLPSLI